MTRKLITVFFILALTATSPYASEIHDAAKAGGLERVKSLSDDDAGLINSLDRFKRTPLHWACRGVHPEVIKYLVEKGADVNARDMNGMQPLHSVASRGHAEAASYLIDKGAEVDSRSEFDGGTPLHYAAENGHAEVVDLLIDRRASATIKDISERTPVHLAAGKGHSGILDRLCQSILTGDPSDLNLQDFDGCTPLQLAGMGGQMEAVKILVSRGADLDIRNSIGESAFNLATEGGFQDIAEFLAAEGANRDLPVFPELKGPYFGQTPPGKTPTIFAKGIISTSLGRHSNIAFSPDLNEIIWRDVSRRRMVYSRNEGGVWRAPVEIPFKDGYSVDAPCYSADGNRVYFMAGPMESSGMVGKEEIWFIDRSDGGWLDPQPADSTVNSIPMHFQFSIDSEGNIYTGGADIYRTGYRNGSYDPPEKLPFPINTEGSEMGPFIAPDGSYLIFNRVSPPPNWQSLLLVSFKNSDGAWSEPQSIDEFLGGWSSLARVSPDGKYLFFLSKREGSARERSVYRVETSFLEDLKKGQKGN